MGTKTNIEWTDATWNPIRGCSRVSEGCRNCYAEKVAYRFSGPGQPYEGLAHKVNGHAAWTGAVGLVQKHLLFPLACRPTVVHDASCSFGARRVQGFRHGLCKCPTRPRRIFVNSMSDLFHEYVPDEWIDRIFAVMALCPQHTFQILTKRPKRMLEYMTNLQQAADAWSQKIEEPFSASDVLNLRWLWHMNQGPAFPHGPWPLPNVWLGVSVENQKTADERIPLLLRTPAAVRFISAEPLLGTVMLPRNVFLPRLIHGDWPIGHNLFVKGERLAFSNPHGALSVRAQAGKMLGIKPGEFEDRGIGLDWVICGGESGSGARPMHPDWARSLRDQCQAAGVPFFFKQWGEWKPSEPPYLKRSFADCDGCSWFGEANVEEIGKHRDTGCLGGAKIVTTKIGKHAAGAMLDGREWREFPPPRQRGPVAGGPGPEAR